MSTQEQIGQNNTSAGLRPKHSNKSRPRGVGAAALEKAGPHLVSALVVVIAATVLWRLGVINIPHIWAETRTGPNQHDYPCEDCPENCPPGSTSNGGGGPSGGGGCPTCWRPLGSSGPPMVTWFVSEPTNRRGRST